jgi:hypothetical protein
VIAHGRFSARGFARAIEVAARGVQEDVIGRTRQALMQAGALRPAPGQEEGDGNREDAKVAPGPSGSTATVSSP